VTSGSDGELHGGRDVAGRLNPGSGVALVDGLNTEMSSAPTTAAVPTAATRSPRFCGAPSGVRSWLHRKTQAPPDTPSTIASSTGAAMCTVMKTPLWVPGACPVRVREDHDWAGPRCAERAGAPRSAGRVKRPQHAKKRRYRFRGSIPVWGDIVHPCG